MALFKKKSLFSLLTALLFLLASSAPGVEQSQASAATNSQAFSKEKAKSKKIKKKKTPRKSSPSKKKKRRAAASKTPVSVRKNRPSPGTPIKPLTLNSNGSLQNLVENEILYLRAIKHLQSGDEVSLQIYDLSEKKMLVDINGTITRNAASLIKPFVMLTVYDQISRQELPETPELEHQMERMIAVSDNQATNQLIRRLGQGNTVQGFVAINVLLRKLGFHQTKVKELIPDGGRTYLNQTSAADATLFFSLLYEQKLVSPHFSQKMNEILLKNVHDRIETYQIKQDGAAVADKTGYVRGLNADCGIVYQKNQPGAHDYVLSVFIENKAKPGEGWGKRKSTVIRYLSDRIYQNLKKTAAVSLSALPRLSSHRPGPE